MGDAEERYRAKRFPILESFLDRLGLESDLRRARVASVFENEPLDEELIKEYLGWVADVQERRKAFAEFLDHLRTRLTYDLSVDELSDLVLYMTSGHAEPGESERVSAVSTR